MQRADSLVSTPSPRVHLGAWDQLRVIAAIDTVAIHLTGRHALYGFGLPLFLILAIALGVSKPEPAPTRVFLTRRFERVITPWVFWAVVLFGARVAERAYYERPLFDWLRPEMLLYGPEIHLWFLPFVVLAGLLAHQAVALLPRSLGSFGSPRSTESTARASEQPPQEEHAARSRSEALPTPTSRGSARPAPWSILGVFALGAVLLVPASMPAHGWPFDQWLFSLPTIALGLGLGRCLALRDYASVRLAATAGLALFVGVGLLVVALRPEVAPYLVRHAGGLGLLVAGTWLPPGPAMLGAFTSRLVPAMLGVYVLHIEVHRHLSKPLLQGAGVYDERWLRVLVAFPLTLLVVLLLRRTPLRRVL